MSYKIVLEGNHYVGYIEGEFFCTGDKKTEVAEEIEKYLSERR